MKSVAAYVVLALVLAIIGAGLSYTAYGESLQPTSRTSTQVLTATSTKTHSSTVTEHSVMTTSSSIFVLSETVEVTGIGSR